MCVCVCVYIHVCFCVCTRARGATHMTHITHITRAMTGITTGITGRGRAKRCLFFFGGGRVQALAEILQSQLYSHLIWYI